MVKYTIRSQQTSQSPKYLTPETVGAILNKHEGISNETCKNLESLIAKNKILPKTLDNILPLNDLCNHKIIKSDQKFIYEKPKIYEKQLE